MKKKRSLKSLKAEADKVFSKFIRERDGWKCVLRESGACCSKGVSDFDVVHCGHMFKRGNWSLRFDELNCHAICPSCNYRDNQAPQHYISWFLNKYGQEKYDELYQRSKQLVDKSAGSMRSWLETIIEKYSTNI